jgi:hypothetical protein
MEHGIYAYIGKLGQGKTYAMTRDVLSYLDKGRIVYTNYEISWPGYKQRPNIWHLFLALTFKKKIELVEYPATNLRYINTDEKFHENFQKLRNCIVALDEAYILFDSYQMAKMSMAERMSILQCRKLDKSILYTVQRASNIHVVLRGMTNVFYECSRISLFGTLKLFRRVAYDLAVDESVDKTAPLGAKIYTSRQKYFDAYDTKKLIGITNRTWLYEELPTKLSHTVRAGQILAGFRKNIESLAGF